MKASVKEHGVVQPVIVARKDGGYHLIVGERRWKAASELGHKEIPAIVKDYTREEMLEVALIENIQREDLNPLEEANAYQFLINEMGLTQELLAKRIGKSRPAVANTLRLLNLSPEIQKEIAHGTISEGHARCLLAIENPQEQSRLCEKIKRDFLSVRQTEDLVRRLSEKKVSRETKKSRTHEWTHIEEEIQRMLGTKVRIIPSTKSKGKIEIIYSTYEDLERLVELLIYKAEVGQRYKPLGVSLL